MYIFHKITKINLNLHHENKAKHGKIKINLKG
jgi:phosphotransferase system IIB component